MHTAILRPRDRFLRGSFLILVPAVLAICTATVQAVDVERFGVTKGRNFIQSDANAPTASVGKEYFFHTFVTAKRFNTLWWARVRPQGGADRPLLVGHDFDIFNSWNGLDYYSNQTALDAAHPDTNYVVTLNTVNDGPVTVTFNLTGSAYPNAPRVANFAAAQAIRAEMDFTLTWDAFTGGTTNDHIRVEIQDVPAVDNVSEVDSPLGVRPFRTGDPREVAALGGTATSVVIPGDTLNAGHNYRAQVRFVKITGLDTNSYPQVTGVAGYVAKTDFPLHTVDVRQVGAVKGQVFQQADANAPVAQSPGFGFQAFVDSRGTSSVAGASIQLPNGGAIITLQATNDFSFKDNTATSGALDAAYPDGIYQLTITNVHDAVKVFSLPVTNTLGSLPVPHISNFAAAQAVNPGKSFTLTWDPLSGGTANDYVQVALKEQSTNGHHSEVFHSGAPLVPTALNGTNTSVTIPAFRMEGGTTYAAQLMFARLTQPLDTNTHRGAVAISACFKRVDFTIRTPDVRAYTLNKRQDFLQTNNAAPVASGTSNFVVHAIVRTPGTNNVTSAALTLPTTPTPTVAPLAATNNFELIAQFSSLAALDAFAPSGTYQFALVTVNDGSPTLSLAVSATIFPNAPQVNGYDLLQAINPHRPLVVTWNAFNGGRTNDHIRLEIVDNNPSSGGSQTVYRTPEPGDLGALTGTNTSLLIPANTLQPGKDYQARLAFATVSTLDTNSYPGVVGGAAFVSRTGLNMHTHGTHPSSPLIGPIIRTNAQTFLSFFGETNRMHRIEVVRDLKLKNWVPVLTNGPAMDGSGVVADGDVSAGSVRFYRVTPIFP